MASIPFCTTHQTISSKSLASSLSFAKLDSRFLAFTTKVGSLKLTSGIGPSNGSRAKCWFKFGKNGVDAEGAGIYVSQSHDDFDRDEVEQGFQSQGLISSVQWWITGQARNPYVFSGSYSSLQIRLSSNLGPLKHFKGTVPPLGPLIHSTPFLS